MPNNRGESIKVVLLGDSGVGKSSLALRFVSDEFRPYSESTIGASFMSKTVEWDDLGDNITGSNIGTRTTAAISTTSAHQQKDEQAVKIETTPPPSTRKQQKRKFDFKIWDTAGQEKYRSLAPMYYRGAAAAILVFDLCKKDTFESLQHWVDELRVSGPYDIKLVICGNKSDLADAHKTVDTDEAREYAQSINASYIETSARDNSNVTELFRKVAEQIPPPEVSGSSGSILSGEDSSASTDRPPALDLRYRDPSNNVTRSKCC